MKTESTSGVVAEGELCPNCQTRTGGRVCRWSQVNRQGVVLSQPETLCERCAADARSLCDSHHEFVAE